MRAPIRAVWYRTRSDLRREWRTLLLLSLLIGTMAGGLIACVAAARRTDTAFDRLRIATSSADVYVETCECSPEESLRAADGLGAVDGVESAIGLRIYSGRFETQDGRMLQEGVGGGTGEMSVIASLDARFGTEVDRPLLISGRRVDADAPSEIVVDREMASAGAIEVGDVILLTLDAEFDDPGSVQHDVALEVVGIVLSPLGVRPSGAETYLAPIFGGPALVRVLGDGGGGGAAVTFAPGADRSVLDGTEFPNVVVDMDDKAAAIDAGTENDTIMLVAIAAVGGLGSALVLTPVAVRAAAAAQRDAASLRTLGFARRDLVARGLIHGAALGTASAAAAAIVAVGVSGRAPIAEARRFEPRPGIDADLAVLIPATLVLLAATTAVIGLATWRSTRVRRAAQPRSPVVARLLGARRIGATGSLGLRIGFTNDTRATNAGYFTSIALATAAVAAAVTFTAGLDRLERTPHLVGVNYDLLLFAPDVDGEHDTTTATEHLEDEVRRILEQPETEAASAGTYFGNSFAIGEDGTSTWLVSFQNGPRAVLPVVISGRAPAADHELLVHPDLLDELGRLGDSVAVHLLVDGEESSAQVTQTYTIVGSGLTPIGGVFTTTSVMTYDGLARLFGREHADQLSAQIVTVRYREGIDAGAATARLAREGIIDGLRMVFTNGSAVESEDEIALNAARDLVRLDTEGAGRVPRALAVLLGSLGTCVLALMIADRVRSWRRRLAIHRALGVTGRQVRVAVLTATLVATAGGVAAALPIGVAAGRALWLRHAGGLGVVPEAPIPWTALGLVVTGAAAVAIVVAVWPAWTAARQRVAIALRAE